MTQTGKRGTIGIVGGGQLGRMLTEAATALGFKVVVVDPNDNCSASQVGAEQIKAAWDDKAALAELAEQSDYVTFETEHLDVSSFENLSSKEIHKINPLPSTVGMIQDKYSQKLFLSSVAPVPAFKQANDADAALSHMQEWGGSMMIKTRRGGYDGRGNMVVRSAGDIKKAFEVFAGRELYAEQLADFKKELAVMVARDIHGNVATYPVTETIHERNICVETFTSADIEASIAEHAEKVALDVAEHLEGAGVFGIEMFLGADDEILVNEIAPRVHNSGHYTIEACETSQFEQHIRAITGMELGPAALKVPAAVMVNILGKRNGPTKVKGLEQAEEIPGVSVHLYGKSPTKIDRKMGHITAVADTLERARERAEQARESIDI